MKLKLFILSLGLFIFSAHTVFATTYAVTKMTDSHDGTCDLSDCSLREAITAANNNNGADEVVLLGALSTVTLSLSGAGEDSNATGDLDITDTTGSLTITGQGNTIDADELDRVIHVVGGADLSITGVTLTNGRLSTATSIGAGLYKQSGDVIIDNCVVTGNIASGSNYSYGGGVYNEGGTLIIADSTVSNNTVNTASNIFGGGLYSAAGEVTISSSTISNNTSTITDAIAYAGGVGIWSGTLTMTNSTISDNTVSSTNRASSGGALYNAGADVTITHSTIANNTTSGAEGSEAGGMYTHGGVFTLTHSIIANNSSSDSAPDCDTQVGESIISGGYNIIGDITGCNFINTSTDQTDTDPLLSTDGLSDNGGDTYTIALQTTPTVSPAINTIPSDVCTLTTDQRGEPRTGYCDIGAYEYQDDATIDEDAAPVITILNNTDEYNTMYLNQTYDDPGATAVDDIDGDLTDAITANASAIDNTTEGNYPLVYTVSDLSNNESSATRTVSVAAVEDADDDEDNDDDGEIDEDNTIDENGEHPKYGDLDPTDSDIHDRVINKVKGWKKGKIRVFYADGSRYKYKIFNKNKKVKKKKTKVKHYRSTGYYVVLQAHGKKVALVNVFNGDVKKRKRVDKKKFKKKKYKYNSIKVFKLRKKYWAVVTSINKQKSKSRLSVIRIKINKTKFGKKKIKKEKGKKKCKKVKVKKTKKKKFRIFLKNKKGKKIFKYKLTKKKKKLKRIKKKK